MIKASVAYEMMEKSLHLIPSHESTSTYLSAYGVFNLESGDCVAVRTALLLLGMFLADREKK